MNVTKAEDIDRVYTYVETDLITKLIPLRALVNNAGVTYVGHVDWGRMDAYKNVMNINTFGALGITLKFLPIIKHSKGIKH